MTPSCLFIHLLAYLSISLLLWLSDVSPSTFIVFSLGLGRKRRRRSSQEVYFHLTVFISPQPTSWLTILLLVCYVILFFIALELVRMFFGRYPSECGELQLSPLQVLTCLPPISNLSIIWLIDLLVSLFQLLTTTQWVLYLSTFIRSTYFHSCNIYFCLFLPGL